MKTPIADFIREYQKRGAARLHMPGHKGKGPLGVEAHDITEIDGADVLYSPTGIIKESEEHAAEIFGTARTVYSTEGSSLSIKAMLALTVLYAKESGKKPLILAARNAHKAFINAAALVDFEIEWIFSDSLMSCIISEDMLKDAIRSCSEKPVALYVTSPDYLGNTSDIRMLSKLCHENGILLIVDNAHGAYLAALPKSEHPIALGADMACDSAHKTLPALTGAAYLHISESAPRIFKERADDMMALFASTSPSYLILESLDLANKSLSGDYREKLKKFIPVSNKLKRRLTQHGHILVGDEVLKITVSTKEYGYTGWDFAEKIKNLGIVCEFYDEDFVTLMLSPEYTESDADELAEKLLIPVRKEAIKKSHIGVPRLRRVMSIKEALFAPSELIPTDNAVGRILALASVSCPPAIPVAVSGELLTQDAADCLSYYRINEVRVIK